VAQVITTALRAFFALRLVSHAPPARDSGRQSRNPISSIIGWFYITIKVETPTMDTLTIRGLIGQHPSAGLSA
jgi:hypothetical protein